MTTHCIDCGARSSSSIGWARADFPLARCQGCNLVFLASWEEDMTEGASFHEGNITYYEQMESDATRKEMNPLNLERLAEPLDRLRRDVPFPSLLDVGCGRGEVVAVAGKRGWTARGIDLAPGAVRIAQSHGLRCDATDFFDGALDDERYGLIYMSEFLEHVPQPHRFLERATQLLLPGGRVYLTTPNFNSMGRRVLRNGWGALVPGHVAFFTAQTLTQIGSKAGLERAEIRTEGVSITALETMLRPRRRRAGPEDMMRTQEFRAAVYGSRWKRAAKDLANPLVARSGLGETLKATFKRP